MAHEKSTRHNVMLYDGDMERMKRLYPNRASSIIRALVRKHLREVNAGQETNLDIDLGIEDE